MLFYTQRRKSSSVYLYECMFQNSQKIWITILFLLFFWNKCCRFVLPCDTWIYYRRVNMPFSLHPASWNITLQPRELILLLYQMWYTKSEMFCLFPVSHRELQKRFNRSRNNEDFLLSLNWTLWHKGKELAPCNGADYFWVNWVLCVNHVFHML